MDALLESLGENVKAGDVATIGSIIAPLAIGFGVYKYCAAVTRPAPQGPGASLCRSLLFARR